MNIQKISLLIIVWMYSSAVILAQKIINMEPKEWPQGQYCQGEKFLVNYMHEFYSFYQKHGLCGYPLYQAEDRSLQIEVIGPGLINPVVIDHIDQPPYQTPLLIMAYEFEAVRTTDIIIKCKETQEYYSPPGCDPKETEITIRTYIAHVTVIPKPPKPSLQVERYISPISTSLNGIKFIASGCPTDRAESFYNWQATSCLDKGFSGETRNLDGIHTGRDALYYRVACQEWSCIGEYSDPEIGLTYSPPDPLCPPVEYRGQISFIESIKQTGDWNSYHHFKVTNEICDTSDPNCSVGNVYNTMTSQNQLIAPKPSDLFLGITGSDAHYTAGSDKVENCKVVNLPGLAPELDILLYELGNNDPYQDPYFQNPKNIYNNPIMTYLDPGNYATINYTLPDHFLSAGRVIRKIVLTCDKVKVITIGEGISDNTFDIITKYLNEAGGLIFFNEIDRRLRDAYVERYK